MIRWFIVGTQNKEMMFYNFEYDFFNKSFLNAEYFRNEKKAKEILKEIDKSQFPTVSDIKIIKAEIELKILCEGDKKTKHKTFVLHWLDNRTEIVHGETISDALLRAGYGIGAFSNLKYYEEVKEVNLVL